MNNQKLVVIWKIILHFSIAVKSLMFLCQFLIPNSTCFQVKIPSEFLPFRWSYSVTKSVLCLFFWKCLPIKPFLVLIFWYLRQLKQLYLSKGVFISPGMLNMLFGDLNRIFMIGTYSVFEHKTNSSELGSLWFDSTIDFDWFNDKLLLVT